MTMISLPDPPTRIIEEPPVTSQPMGSTPANIIISVATAADSIAPWGVNPRTRDMQLRAFWPTEPYFSGGLFTVVAQYIAFNSTLTGPPRMVGIYEDMLNSVQFGQGMEQLLELFLIDMFTQDNGAFIEIVRTDNDPRAPCITLNHLDAYRCRRTGVAETPVAYTDSKGREHLLQWYQVLHMTEFPSPIEEAHGIQYCALTRILRAAQIMRDIAVVNQEKAAGRFTRQIHLVGGVQRSVIEDIVRQKQAEADAIGLTRFIQPVIVASLDPTARVSKETIDMASVPAEYDEQKAMETYLMLMAMVFGTDYQNFAPLPGGGLGSSSQSKVLNMKSRGKGPGKFMRKFSRAMNFHGILPRTVTFSFGEQDVAEQMERTELRKERALELEILIRAGVITTEVARQMAVDTGDLDARYLRMMHEENATHEVIVGTVDRVPRDEPVEIGMPGPKEPPKAQLPAGAIDRPPNSNAERNRGPAANQKRVPGGSPEGGARA